MTVTKLKLAVLTLFIATGLFAVGGGLAGVSERTDADQTPLKADPPGV